MISLFSSIVVAKSGTNTDYGGRWHPKKELPQANDKKSVKITKSGDESSDQEVEEPKEVLKAKGSLLLLAYSLVDTSAPESQEETEEEEDKKKEEGTKKGGKRRHFMRKLKQIAQGPEEATGEPAAKKPKGEEPIPQVEAPSKTKKGHKGKGKEGKKDHKGKKAKSTEESALEAQAKAQAEYAKVCIDV